MCDKCLNVCLEFLGFHLTFLSVCIFYPILVCLLLFYITVVIIILLYACLYFNERERKSGDLSSGENLRGVESKEIIIRI